MGPWRAVSFASAALLVAALTWLALSARHRIDHSSLGGVDVVLSEIEQPSPPPAPLQPPAPLADIESTFAAEPPTQASEPNAGVAAEPPTIVDPEWISRPAHPERYYPRAAFLSGVEGRVELACFVETDGRLTCDVVSELPLGHGFGDAAMEIARGHVMRPAIRDGQPVRARYRMVVPFRSG